MFRLATNIDMLSLKFEGPGDIFSKNQHVEWSWGLKSFGYMLAVKHINSLEISRPVVVEAGAGLGDILYKKLFDRIDYTAVDRAGFYDEVRFKEALASRGSSKFVDGHFGDFCDELPDESADVICSVSVLEHVPPEQIHSAVEDMTRVLKPGGLFVHTLDVSKGKAVIWESYLEAIYANKLEFSESPQPIDFTDDGLLYEPLPIVYRTYQKKEDLKLKKKAVSRHQGAISIVAHKL